MAGLAGSSHFDAVDSQLGGEIPQHVGLLHGGLVVERVSHGQRSLKRGEVGGVEETGREKSPLADKNRFKHPALLPTKIYSDSEGSEVVHVQKLVETMSH